MKTGSLVRYIGGADIVGQKLSPLHTSEIYTVSEVCFGKFHIIGWKPAIYLFEKGNKYAFRMDMFEELQDPKEVNVEQLLNETLDYDRLSKD